MTTRDDLGSFFLKLAPELDTDARKYGIKPITAREAADRTAQYLRDNFDLHGSFSVQPEYSGMSGHDIVRTAEGDGYIDGDLKLRLEVTPTGRPYARYTASIAVPVRRGRVLRPSTIYPEGYEPLLCGQAAFDALAHADVGAGAWARNTKSASVRTAAYPTETTLGGWMDADEEAADARLASPESVVVTIQANDGSGRPTGPAQSFSAPARNMGEYPRALQVALDEALNAVEVDGSDPQVAFVTERGHPAMRIKTGMGLTPGADPSAQGIVQAPGGFSDTFVGGATIVIQFVGDPVHGVDLKETALEELYRVVVEPLLLGDAAALRQAAVESGRLPARQAAAYFDRSVQSAQSTLAWAKMLVQLEGQARKAAAEDETALIERLKSVLTPDLRKGPWAALSNDCDPMTGHCYVASEALHHLLGPDWKPMYIKHEDSPHWFLKHKDGRILDATSSQFKTPVPYDQGKGKGFLTKTPSARARQVLERMQAKLARQAQTQAANQTQVSALLSDTRQRSGYTKGLARWRSRYEA